MKFVRKDLLYAVESLKKLTASNKRSIPITENFLYDPETRTMFGTDLETYVLIPLSYEAGDTDEFKFCVNVKQMIAILKGIRSDHIEIVWKPEAPREGQKSLYGNKMWLTINRNHHIIGECPEDYPAFPDFDDVQWASGELKTEWIKRAYTMIPGKGIDGREDRRPHVCNMLLTAKEIVSTDGSRLHWLKKDTDMSRPLFIEKGLATKLACLGDAKFGTVGDADTTFCFAVFAYPNMLILNRENVGEFPRFEEIIWRKGGHVFTANTSEFQALMEKFAMLTSDNYKGVLMDIHSENLYVSYTNPDWGEVEKEEIAASCSATESIRVAVNPNFVVDALKAIRTEKVEVSVISEERPLIFYEPDARENFMAVVMPMRI